MDCQGLTFTIVGLERSGWALARLVLSRGGQIRIMDQKPFEAFSPEIRSWLNNTHCEKELGNHSEQFLKNTDFVLLSPGVPFDAPVLKWARSASIPIIGEIEFAYQFCDKRVIAVTGSNGKTTTVTLISQLLNMSNVKNVLCGNIGHPFADVVPCHQDIQFVVVEVSSFQAESILSDSDLERVRTRGLIDFKGFRPYVAMCLNISQNHLDRHKTMDQYASAKKRLFRNQTKKDFAILNNHGCPFKEWVDDMKSQVRCFDESKSLNTNYAAVSQLARLLKIDQAVCDRLFKSFPGVEHRMESCGEIGGVVIINDSKSTTTEAGRWALERCQGEVLLICGGRDKDLDFTVLQDIVGRKVKLCTIYGEAAEKIYASFKGSTNCHIVRDISQAFEESLQVADPGDSVLFSPMCTSFDMFANYEERGRAFKKILQFYQGGVRA